MIPFPSLFIYDSRKLKGEIYSLRWVIESRYLASDLGGLQEMKKIKIPFRQTQRHEIKEIELSDTSSVSTISIFEDHESGDYRPVSFVGLARYALPRDRALHGIGVIFCMIAGTALVWHLLKSQYSNLIQ